jgi:hypothetical protein
VAAGTHEYTTIFAIGGKLLGSFRGAMNAANARLAKLRASTLSFGKSILKLTSVFALLGSTIAGFGISAILGSLFKGATEQAKEARQRINATIASFLQLREIQKKGGWDQADKELKIIMKQNEALGKQGVLHSDIYNEMTKQLAQGGVPPRQIKAAVGAMGDLLVKTRGVNATEAEGAELADAVTKAIHGRTRGLQAFGIFLDATKIDASGKKVKKTYQELYEEILRISQGYEGFNKRAADTPEGQVQVLQNRLQDIREDIGNKMLPVQAKFAKAWLDILTDENIQLLKDAIDWIFSKMTKVVDLLRTKWIPYLKSDEGRRRLRQIGNAFVWIAKHAKTIGLIILGIIAAMYGLQVATAAINFLTMGGGIGALLAIAGAVALIIDNWDAVKAAVADYVASIRAIPEEQQTGWQKFFNWWYTEWGNIIDDFSESALWKEIASIDWGRVWGKLTKWWDDTIAQLRQNWTDFSDWFSKVDWTFGFAKKWHDAIEEWKRGWNEIKGNISTLTHPSRWFGRGGGAAGAAGGAGGAAAAAAATAPAQTAAAQVPLTPEGVKALQAERADIVAEMKRPELRNLISATLATEASGAEDQKNVLEGLVNRLAAQKEAGTYKGVEAAIKSGFYGPYNRGETAAVMSKGLSDVRSQQVGSMIDELGAGRNALGGLTDQGMINEIKGAIKEQHGEDFYGLQGIAGEKQTAAYKYSRGYQQGGIARTPQIATLAERGPEMVLPLPSPSALPSPPGGAGGGAGMLARMRGYYGTAKALAGGFSWSPPTGGMNWRDLTEYGHGRPTLTHGLLGLAEKLAPHSAPSATHVNFAPNITINGDASEAEQKALDAKLRNLAREFIESFKRAQYQERRLSYESGYG